MPGSGRKVFANGNTLSASDVQNFLQDQSVMYYANTAARTAGIASPSTGMVSYVGDTPPQIETYTGAAWQNLSGAVFIGSTTFTGVSAFTVSGCFTSAYDNYFIYLNLTSGTTNSEIRCQLDASGTPAAGTGYAYARFGSTAATGTSLDGNNGTSYFPVTYIPGTNSSSSFMYLANPQDAVFTTFNAQFIYDDGSLFIGGTTVGRHRVATSYNGIRFFNPTTMTGTVKVYGMRKS